MKIIVDRGFLTPLFYDDPPILPTPFSKFVLFLRLMGVIAPHMICYFLLNDLMNLHMSNLVTLVPPGPCGVFFFFFFFCNKAAVYWGVAHDVVFTSTLLWYHVQTKTHIEANRLIHPHEYILTSLVMCLLKLSVLHWVNNLLISKFYFSIVLRCLFFPKITDL